MTRLRKLYDSTESHREHTLYLASPKKFEEEIVRGTTVRVTCGGIDPIIVAHILSLGEYNLRKEWSTVQVPSREIAVWMS